jgi:hypothetical protein
MTAVAERPRSVGVAGNFSPLGNWDYTLNGPGCSYLAALEAPRGGSPVGHPGHVFKVQCPSVAATSTLFVYESTGANTWTLTDSTYPKNAGTPGPAETIVSGTAAEKAQTFVACTESALLPYPGQNGCDEPSTISPIL